MIDRRETVLLALGFCPPSQNTSNPHLWFNKHFPAIEVDLQPDYFEVSGVSSTYINRDRSLSELIYAIQNQLLVLIGSMADEELN